MLNLRTAFLAALLLAAGLTAPATPESAAAPPGPFAPAHDFVAIADRPVCSLLAKTDPASVRGEDGGFSTVGREYVFWGFGDSYVGITSGAPNRPNGLGYSHPPAFDPAADCIRIYHKRSGTSAQPLLNAEPDECSVWSSGMASLQGDTTHLMYLPVPDCNDPAPAGLGLGTFDAGQTPEFASERDGLIWPPEVSIIDGAHPFPGGDGYLYIALHGPPANPASQPFGNTLRLARLPEDAPSLEACVPYNAPACPMRYWTGSGWAAELASAAVVVAPELGMNGGVTLAPNDALDGWLASYVSGLLFAVRGRLSPSITGAWSTEETLLSYCPHFFEPGFGYCYTGALHPEYDVAGGHTIYLTMSTNRIPDGVIDEYSVFLHEITLGMPVRQFASGAVRRYGIGSPPPAYTTEGVAFYAAAAPIIGFQPVYEWTNPSNGDVLLGLRQPSPAHTQRSDARFYAPPRMAVAGYANAYEPVYRWDKSATEHLYSPLTAYASLGYTNAGIAFYTLCGDADADYLGDCAEMNSAGNPSSANYNVDGDVLLDANGNPVLNAFGLPVPLGNMQSVAQDNGVRRADIDNCPLANNPHQQNTDSGSIATGVASGPDVTRPTSDILGDACDPDRDNDGRTDAQEQSTVCAGSSPTNPLLRDSDGDRYSDTFECLANSNPTNGALVPPPPAAGTDPDGDGLTSALEALLGTDPSRADTDGDGLGDRVEAAFWSTDPLSADTDADGCVDGVEAASVDRDWSAGAADVALVQARVSPAPYAEAFDIDRNGSITSADVQLASALAGVCVPPRHIDRDASQYGAPATSDKDGDGCTDAQETAGSAIFGGQRNPEYPWDFFDVTGDRTIDLNDALEVLQAFGAAPGDAGYDPLLDRRIADAGAPWRTAADLQDNGISLVEALVALQSFGHSCN